MKDLEANKIFAAILVAGIIAMFAGFIAEVATHPHELEEDAIAIEGTDIVAGGGAPKEALPEPILAMIATADVERGQKVSKACAACHSFTKGGANGVGPNLWNVVGIPKQAKDGYSYSGVLNVQGEDNWTYASLNKFIAKPKKYAPGTKMNYLGLKKPADRANVVAWLRTLSDSPKPLPTDAEIAAEEAELAPPEDEEGTEPVSDTAAEQADAANPALDVETDATDATDATGETDETKAGDETETESEAETSASE